MYRRLCIIGFFFVVLVFSGNALLGIGITQRTRNAAPVFTSPTPQTEIASVSAILAIENGTVEIQSNDTWTPISDGYALTQGNSVRTSQDAHATLVFQDIGELRLEPKTEITLTALTPLTVLVYQAVGDTYSKVKKLLDPASSYEVETPTAVASVRGTAFAVLVDESKESRVVVSENIVAVSPVIHDGITKRTLPAASVTENQGTVINRAVIEQALANKKTLEVTTGTQVLPEAKIHWIEKNRKKDSEFERKDREKLLRVIEKVSSSSTKPIPELDDCTGEACIAFCTLPENLNRCEQVKREKLKEGVPKNKRGEKPEKPEKPEEQLSPAIEESPSSSPIRNPIRQMIQPIQEAIERLISPSPRAPELAKPTPLLSPATSSAPSNSIIDKNNEKKEFEEEREKKKEADDMRIILSPSPAILIKPLENPPVLLPVSPFLKP